MATQQGVLRSTDVISQHIEGCDGHRLSPSERKGRSRGDSSRHFVALYRYPFFISELLSP